MTPLVLGGRKNGRTKTGISRLPELRRSAKIDEDDWTSRIEIRDVQKVFANIHASRCTQRFCLVIARRDYRDNLALYTSDNQTGKRDYQRLTVLRATKNLDSRVLSEYQSVQNRPLACRQHRVRPLPLYLKQFRYRLQ